MTKRWNKTECFDYFGVKTANPRWSWSGRSEDGAIVALTLWQDKLKPHPEGGLIYVDRDYDGIGWVDTPGNSERRANLKHALAHCDGKFRVVIARAKDVRAAPRAIAECFPHPSLIMQLVELDDRTRQFVARSAS